MFEEILIFIISIIGIIYFIVSFKFKFFSNHGVIGMKPKFPFGNIKASFLGKRNIIYDIDDVYRHCKGKAPFAGFYMTFNPYLLIIEPEHMKQVMIKDFKSFRNNEYPKFIDEKRDRSMTRTPLCLKDDKWLSARSELAPIFTHNKLHAMYPLTLECAKKLSCYINKKLQENKSIPFDVRDICARYTCDTISSCVFDTDAKSFESEKSLIYENGKKFADNMREALRGYLSKPLVSTEVEDFFFNVMKESIKSRKESEIERDDILSYLLSLQFEKNLDDLDICEYGTILFFDGFETSSNAIMNALYELGNNKKVQDKLREEIQNASKKNETIDYYTLINLPYLDQVFNETIRMHPPVTYSTRVCTESIELDGVKGHKYLVKEGDKLILPFYSLHHDQDHFERPDHFNPERFNVGVKVFRDRGVFFPFGDGPRICVGMNLAILESKSAIAEIVKNFEISVDPSTPTELLIGPKEFVNIKTSKLFLNFKSI